MAVLMILQDIFLLKYVYNAQFFIFLRIIFNYFRVLSSAVYKYSKSVPMPDLNCDFFK